MAWQRGRAYGQDLRERVLAAQGSIRQVAERFAVSQAYVARARGRRRRGELCARPQHNHVPPRLAGLQAAIEARVAAGNDATLAQLRDWIERELGVRVGMTTVFNTLARLGLTLKKRACTRPSSSAPT